MLPPLFCHFLTHSLSGRCLCLPSTRCSPSSSSSLAVSGFSSSRRMGQSRFVLWTFENDISFPGLPYPLDNGSLGFSEEFELVFPRGEAEQNLHLIHCLFQIHHPQNPNVMYIKDAFYRWTTLKLLPMASTRNLGPSCITSPISSRFLMPSIENLK